MKTFSTLLLSTLLSVAAFGQSATHSKKDSAYLLPDLKKKAMAKVHDSSGRNFTDKSGAVNQTVNGVKDGRWVQYFKVKKGLEIETKSKHSPFYRLTVYKAGKPFGTARTYFKDGKLEGEMFFENGKQNGIAKVYYKTGQLCMETPYTDGRINGVRKMYSPGGKVMLIDTFMNGREHGVIKLYYANGTVKTECPFTNEKANTHEKISFDSASFHLYETDGYIVAENILNGRLNGVMKEYYDDGMLKSQATFKDDVMLGDYKAYDDSGNEIK